MLTRIIEMCKMRNVTQKDLTDALGLRSSAFSEWKSGKSKSYAKYVHHIAFVLGTTAEYLQGTTDTIEPLGKAPAPSEVGEALDFNTVIIRGRDGNVVTKKLSNEQIKVLEAIIDQFPDAPDDL